MSEKPKKPWDERWFVFSDDQVSFPEGHARKEHAEAHATALSRRNVGRKYYVGHIVKDAAYRVEPTVVVEHFAQTVQP